MIILERQEDTVININKFLRAMCQNKMSSAKRIKITMPDGSVINNKYAYQTMAELFRRVGLKKIEEMGLVTVGQPLISKKKHPKAQYAASQREIGDGYLLTTYNSTRNKLRWISMVNERFNLNILAEAV